MVNGPTQVMCTEHAQMRYMLEEIEKQQTTGFNEDYLMALGHFLNAHNEKEEKIIYPVMNELSDNSLQESMV